MTDKITYKKPRDVEIWLDVALKKERQKYAATPVTPDMIADHEVAQAWGYVVAGYFLIEQGIKAVLYVRGSNPPKTHTLSTLFRELPAENQDVLRMYYDDFLHAFPGMNSFPLETLDKFLENLDGGQNGRGHFDWRYFPTEARGGVSMPRVSIDVMHEIVYGCVLLVRSIINQPNDAADDKVGNYTYSWRLQSGRSRRYNAWLTVRMNSPEWKQEGDRLEILWGPDYRGRYDYLVFKDGRRRCFFAPLPKEGEIKMRRIDKRKELESFDPKEGLRRIGIYTKPVWV